MAIGDLDVSSVCVDELQCAAADSPLVVLPMTFCRLHEQDERVPVPHDAIDV
jgi:hypothetical protein